MITTEHSIAIDSPDYLHPLGAVRNNVNPRMVAWLNTVWKQPSVLDLGCAGGGFVREMIEAGSYAIGVDGTDHPLKPGSKSDWNLNPQNYYTADITKPFNLTPPYGVIVLFDVVTMFEVWEHIPEKYLHAVLDNINNHTHKESICVFSASNDSSVSEGVELHVTKQNREWWLECFGQRGWVECDFQSEVTEEIWYPWVGPSTMHFVMEKAP